MVNILLNGINGKMGKTIEKLSYSYDNLKIVCGVDNFSTSFSEIPVYKDFSNIKENVDIIIDFSHPSSLTPLLEFGIYKKTGIVICTTGHTDTQINEINEASKQIPIFMSYNMSIGINLMQILIKKATESLFKDYDIEITEKHHNQKLDSPSGTAIMLMNTIESVIKNDFNNQVEFIHGRFGEKKRDKHEIGVHAVRGGTIIGEHEVMFAGNSEIIEIRHSAISRDVFAEGALKAALFLNKKQANMYNMNSLLNFK